jgi:hypothetical protein
MAAAVPGVALSTEELLLLQAMEADLPVQRLQDFSGQQSSPAQKQQQLSLQQLQDGISRGPGLQRSCSVGGVSLPPFPVQDTVLRSYSVNTLSTAAAGGSSTGQAGSSGAGSNSGWWDDARTDAAANPAFGGSSCAAAAAVAAASTLAPDNDLLFMFRQVFSMPPYPGRCEANKLRMQQVQSCCR